MTLLLSVFMDTISRAMLIACISAENMDASTGKDTALTTVPQTAAAPTPASPLEPSEYKLQCVFYTVHH